MSDTKNISLNATRLSAVALILALGIVGCSGTSDPGSSDIEPAGESEVNTTDGDDASTSITASSDVMEPDSGTLVSDGNGESDSSTDPESESPPVVLDPSSSTTTRVYFEITVPTYMSNELQVRLDWGEIGLSAQWVGDEFWSASMLFPTSTEHLLVVTFFDRNGDISLGTVERIFRTGINSAENVSITADDFDTGRWDEDSDGVSNIDELRLGTDPLVSNVLFEPESVDLLYTFSITSDIGYAAAYYEPELLTLVLPVDIHEESFVDNLPYQSDSTSRDIVISTDGNGTYSKTHDIYYGQDSPFHRSSAGTRSRQGGTVGWSGTQLLRSSSVFYNAYVEEVFETSNTISERELVQQSRGTITRKTAHYENKGNITEYNYEIVLDLDSMDSENTCTVLRGNIYRSFEQQVDNPSFTEQTVGRSSVDENWAWFSISDGEITRGEAIELSDRFYCNFLIND